MAEPVIDADPRPAEAAGGLPDRAMATLPDLLRTAEERRRLLDIFDRLTDRVDLEPEQRAMLPRFHDLLAPIPEAVPAAGSAPRRRRTG